MQKCLAAVLVLALTACVQTNAAALNPTTAFARTCPEAVIVYTTPDRVKNEYVEVALLNSSGNSNSTTESGMIRSQQKKAAEVGANAIILGGITEPGAWAKVAAAVLGTATERKGKALAIWVPADSARTRATCAMAAQSKCEQPGRSLTP